MYDYFNSFNNSNMIVMNNNKISNYHISEKGGTKGLSKIGFLSKKINKGLTLHLIVAL